MRRDLIINFLLVIAGIVLAIVLFGAGAIWRGRIPTKAPRTSNIPLRMQGLCEWMVAIGKVTSALSAQDSDTVAM